jgi:gamma-glutamylcyclotransferase
VTLLFAYGSNMASAEMQAWCPAHRFVGPARLDGFRVELRRRSIRWGGGAADIVPAAGESVWGVLYEVAEEELDRLDEKEGAGFAYRRRAVEVEREGGPRAAVAYEVVDKEPSEVPCSREYAELVLAGARERGLPGEWVRELAGITAG